MTPLESGLYHAAKDGKAIVVSSFLAYEPKINPNWTDAGGWTALHVASFNGHAAIVAQLLSHPGIDVNHRNDSLITPFFLACNGGDEGVVKLYLKDPRTELNLPGPQSCTPLWIACRYGCSKIVKWMIASGRHVEWGKMGKPWGSDELQAPVDIAQREGHEETATLLEEFLSNPEKLRHRVKLELGILDELAADMFAVVVFLCDDLLKTRSLRTTHPATRFCHVAAALPMELQMILCHRVVGSPKETVLSRHSEPAFRKLASQLAQETSSTVPSNSEGASNSGCAGAALTNPTMLPAYLFGAFFLGLGASIWFRH